MLRKPEDASQIPDGRRLAGDRTRWTLGQGSIAALVALLAPSLQACSCSLSDPCDRSMLIAGMDLQAFDTVPRWDRLPFDEIEPADDFEYWALREYGWISGNPHSHWLTLHFAGPLSFEELDPEDRELFDSIPTIYGFWSGWIPHGRHFISVRQGEARVWHTEDEAKEFLGTIDSPTEGILVALMQNYYFESNDRRIAGIAETDSGFLIVAQKTMRSCDPFKIGRYLLHVARNGELRVLANETVSRRDYCVIE